MLVKIGLELVKATKYPMALGPIFLQYVGIPMEGPSLFQSTGGALKYCVITKLEITYVMNKLC